MVLIYLLKYSYFFSSPQLSPLPQGEREWNSRRCHSRPSPLAGLRERALGHVLEPPGLDPGGSRKSYGGKGEGDQSQGSSPTLYCVRGVASPHKPAMLPPSCVSARASS